MDYDMEKLKSRIAEKFEHRKDFAAAIGASEATVSRYLTGASEWKSSTMLKAAEVLEIDPKDLTVYFFTRKVAKKQPKGKT